MKLCYNRHSQETFDMFVEWLLHGLGDPTVKELAKGIEPKLNGAWYKTFNLGLFLKYPYDYLGRFGSTSRLFKVAINYGKIAEVLKLESLSKVVIRKVE